MFGSNKPYNPLLSEPVLKVAATESYQFYCFQRFIGKYLYRFLL